MSGSCFYFRDPSINFNDSYIYLAKDLKSTPRHALNILKKHQKEGKDTPLNEIHIRSSEALRPWALSFNCA